MKALITSIKSSDVLYYYRCHLHRLPDTSLVWLPSSHIDNCSDIFIIEDHAPLIERMKESYLQLEERDWILIDGAEFGYKYKIDAFLFFESDLDERAMVAGS